MADEILAVPARCAHRPLVGGRVVPAVSVVLHDGRPVLGVVHRQKAVRCIVERRCQICGERLTRPMVVLVDEKGLAGAYAGEAPLHPECAAYSVLACPVLAGRRDTFRAPDKHLGVSCGVPGCGCDGWVDTEPERPPLRGRPVGRWFAVWLDNYDIAVNERREVHGLTWQGSSPLRVRPVHPDPEGIT